MLCYEPESNGVFAGIGAALFDPKGSRARFISQRLPQQLVAELNPSGKKTAIDECDFFALSCAFLEWGHLVSSAAVIYTGNNAVRDTLISCGTSNPTARLLLVATLALECEFQLTPWYSRVPTDSNSSDAPSRLSCKDRLDAGVAETPVDTERSWQRLQQLQQKWGEQQAQSQPLLAK